VDKGKQKNAKVVNKKMKYIVTREFTSGTLKGKLYTETTSVKFEVGFICRKPCAGSSGYKIISCEEVKEEM